MNTYERYGGICYFLSSRNSACYALSFSVAGRGERQEFFEREDLQRGVYILLVNRKILTRNKLYNCFTLEFIL